MFALPFVGPWLLKKGIKGGLAAGIQIGIIVFIGILIFLAYSAVKNHFDHISDLETANEQLTLKVTKVEGQRDQVIQLNKENEKTRVLNQDIEANNELIAGQERAAAAARAATYKEIGNAIRNTPSQPGRTGVAPVVTNTLDSLWGPSPR